MDIEHDFNGVDTMDLFLIRSKEFTGAIVRILEPFKLGEVQYEIVYNPFGLRRVGRILYNNLYPIITRRNDNHPNLVLVFEHLEAYSKVAQVANRYGFISTLGLGHVYYHPLFRFHLFDIQKIHLYKDRVMMWSYYETYTPEGVKALTQFANKMSLDLDFPCELRAYNKQSLGFNPRNVRYFLNQGWIYEDTFWQNKHGNIWPDEKPYVWPKKEPYIGKKKGPKRKMDKFPGRVEAEALGYELHNYTPDQRKATYVKHLDNDRGRPTHVIVWLTIVGFEHFTAHLSSVYKAVSIAVDSFQWPNKNFALFEKQIIHVAEAAQLVTEE